MNMSVILKNRNKNDIKMIWDPTTEKENSIRLIKGIIWDLKLIILSYETWKVSAAY